MMNVMIEVMELNIELLITSISICPFIPIIVIIT
jgi:hypothetical protein